MVSLNGVSAISGDHAYYGRGITPKPQDPNATLYKGRGWSAIGPTMSGGPDMPACMSGLPRKSQENHFSQDSLANWNIEIICVYERMHSTYFLPCVSPLDSTGPSYKPKRKSRLPANLFSLQGELISFCFKISE
jgi:hypothetical protein